MARRYFLRIEVPEGEDCNYTARIIREDGAQVALITDALVPMLAKLGEAIGDDLVEP